MPVTDRSRYPLSRDACLMKCHTPIRPDRVFTQLRFGPAGPIQDDKHLTAFRRNLDAEAGAAGVPVDYV